MHSFAPLLYNNASIANWALPVNLLSPKTLQVTRVFSEQLTDWTHEGIIYTCSNLEGVDVEGACRICRLTKIKRDPQVAGHRSYREWPSGRGSTNYLKRKWLAALKQIRLITKAVIRVAASMTRLPIPIIILIITCSSRLLS